VSGYTPRRTVFTPVSTHRIHGVAKKGAAEAQNQAQQKDAKGGSEWHEWTTNPEGTEGSAVPCETRLVAAKGQSGGGGIRTILETPAKTAVSGESVAKSGALAIQDSHIDPALTTLIDAWPTLPKAMRAGILAMVRAAGA